MSGFFLNFVYLFYNIAHRFFLLSDLLLFFLSSDLYQVFSKRVTEKSQTVRFTVNCMSLL